MVYSCFIMYKAQPKTAVMTILNFVTYVVTHVFVDGTLSFLPCGQSLSAWNIYCAVSEKVTTPITLHFKVHCLQTNVSIMCGGVQMNSTSTEITLMMHIHIVSENVLTSMCLQMHVNCLWMNTFD